MKINAHLSQFEHLTLGELSKMTIESKSLLNDMKNFQTETSAVEETISAQDILDSIDTKIRSPRY